MSVSLSDQIGAMSLVDQLRHREMALQEYLDLPQRRAEVAQGIRTYYQNNGIAFDEDAIEEGVRAFFSRRLMFEAPPSSRLQRMLTVLIMARRSLLSLVLGGVAAVLFTLGAFYLINHGKNVDVGRMADRLVTDSQALQEQIGMQRQRLEQVKRRLERQPNATAAQLVAKIERLLPGPTLYPDIARPDAITRDNRGPFKIRLDQAQFELATVQLNLTSVRRRLNRVVHVLDSLDRQRQLLQRIKALPLPAANQRQLLDWNNRAGQEIASLRLRTADATLQTVADYLDFAAEPLTLELVDRPGIKSGVERCYEDAGCSPSSTRGKSWYLIVEPLDAAGKPALVPVTSIEDGKTSWANRFGVRVSYDEYLKVRQDKLDDGHISQRVIGDKPANSLNMRFSQRTSPIPDMILQW